MKKRTQKSKYKKLKNEIREEAIEENERDILIQESEDDIIAEYEERDEITKEPIEVIEEPNQRSIDIILDCKSRNIPLSDIANKVGYSVDCVEKVISSASERFDQKIETINHTRTINKELENLQTTRNTQHHFIDTLDVSMESYIKLREIELDSINKKDNAIIELIKEKTKVIRSVPKDIDNHEITRLTYGEQKLYDIIYNNPSISSDELVKKMGLCKSRIKQLLMGYGNNRGLINKGYIQIMSKAGTKRLYYSAIVK